ncbi:MAG: hypothetical protein ABIJ22_00765 [Patescibacteria group bacterium]
MKKLNLQIVRSTFREKGLKLFGAKELLWFFEATQRSVELFLHRNLKKGFLTQVKKDLYFFSDYQPHAFLVANQAYQPSYVSLETALSYHQMIPETVYTITSVTSQSTQEFSAGHLHLQYHKIKIVAFTGYTLRQLHEDTALVAEPAKALADYLYFVSMGRKILNDRLDFSKVKLAEVNSYVRLFNYKPLNNLFSLL